MADLPDFGVGVAIEQRMGVSMNARDTVTDPDAGRWIVVGVAAIGLLGIVAYGVMESRDRTDASVSGPTSAAISEAPPLADLTARAKAARRALDVRALAELDKALAHASSSTTLPPKAVAARLERVDVLAAIA